MVELAVERSLRQAQMRNLARQLRVVDEFGGREENIQTNELRLISRPIYEYKRGEIIESTMFVYALGTDPEAFMLLEAIIPGDGEKPRWRYAFGESTIYELNAFLGEEKVWSMSRAQILMNPTFKHFAGPYRHGADDVNLDRGFGE